MDLISFIHRNGVHVQRWLVFPNDLAGCQSIRHLIVNISVEWFLVWLGRVVSRILYTMFLTFY